MYIAKWWGNMIGDSDESLSLIDYFEHKKEKKLKLGTILHDLMLDKYLGKVSLQQSREMFFTIKYPDGRSMEVDFNFSIIPVMDLCAILLEQAHSGSVNTKELVPSSQRPITFEIELEKEPLRLLLDELSHFASDPLSYDLADMVPDEDMAELAAMCEEIAEELEEYYKKL